MPSIARTRPVASVIAPTFVVVEPRTPSRPRAVSTSHMAFALAPGFGCSTRAVCKTWPDGLTPLDLEPHRAWRRTACLPGGLYGLWPLASLHSHDQCAISSSASARSYGATAPTTSSLSAVAEPRRTRLIAVLPAPRRTGLFGRMPAVAVRGQTAVWISRVNAYHELGFTITLLRSDQRVGCARSARGRIATGWRGQAPRGRDPRWGKADRGRRFQQRAPGELRCGWICEGGRVGWPLRRGAASVVIYRDGTADVGRWQETVPARGRAVEAVRQNLGLLIDAGRISSTVDNCIKAYWVICCTSSRSSLAQLSASRPVAI